MRDIGASYWQIVRTVGCSVMTAERVVMRWTHDNHRTLLLALTNRRMTTTEIRAEVTGKCQHKLSGTDYWKLDWDLKLPSIVYRWHHTRDNRDLHGVEPKSAGTLSYILWCSVMSLSFVCGSQIDANVSIDDLVKGHKKQRLSRHVETRDLNPISSICSQRFMVTHCL